MRPGRFYMHKDGMDVCIEVIKSYHVRFKRYSIKARWWNLGYVGNPFVIEPDSERIDIMDSNDWVDVTDTMYHTRTQSGPPV